MSGRTPLHLLSWCGTRMAYFLDACELFNEVLVEIYNTLVSVNAIADARDRLFSPSNIYVLKLREIFENF